MPGLLPPLAPHGDQLMTLAQLTAFGASIGAAALGALPCVIALSGDLGAGKTTLTRAIGLGFGVGDPVTSPTFALVHEYRTHGGDKLYHVDLYRITRAAELANLGWETLLADRALLIIEWPNRAAGFIPGEALGITLAHVDTDETRRRVMW